jgi:predicted PurR-regulated permease PerM
MLIRKQHMSVRIESWLGERIDVPLFVSRASNMVRGFVIGNLIIGVVMSVVTVGVLELLKVQGAIPLGIASGILNLIPFLGLVLATAVPCIAALMQFSSVGPFVIIAVSVIALHLISANILIPKFVGSRVNIGPVSATLGILFWGWLWGVVGLLLAIPLTAFVKIVADSHPSLIHLSNLLAETPRPVAPKFLAKRGKKARETAVSPSEPISAATETP